jgi:hypothetical protein
MAHFARRRNRAGTRSIKLLFNFATRCSTPKRLHPRDWRQSARPRAQFGALRAARAITSDLVATPDRLLGAALRSGNMWV